jgi:hypothetical protein
MVGSALIAMMIYKLGCTTIDLLVITAGLNLVFAGLLAATNREYFQGARRLLFSR